MTVLITGGSACGKSVYAEKLCMSCSGPHYYIAAMQPYGAEAERRISRHRAMREGKGFITIERYTDYEGLILPVRGTALLECLGNLTANEMFSGDSVTDPTERVIGGIDALQKQCDNLIIVTNETGSDGIVYDEYTESYISALGRINAITAQRADTVIECTSGIPVVIKGEIDP